MVLSDVVKRSGFLEFTSDSFVIRINEDKGLLLRHPEFEKLLRADDKEQQTSTVKEVSAMDPSTVKGRVAA